jgi:hypothetical protein
MKDYFDARALLHEGEMDTGLLARAIAATFRRRRTALPDGVPAALSDGFASDAAKQAQWRAFLRKNRIDAPALEEVVSARGWPHHSHRRANARRTCEELHQVRRRRRRTRGV